MILRAYVVPHPPIVLAEVGRGEEIKIADTVAAYKRVAKEIKELAPDTIVLCSPHAPFYQNAFYIAAGTEESGNLQAFRVPGVDVRVELDAEYAGELSWQLESIGIHTAYKIHENETMDHGVLIPLRFLQAEYRAFKLVHIGLSLLSAARHEQVGQAIAQVADSLDRRVIFIGSGDLSHVLLEDGPYGYKPEGPEFDAEMMRIFSQGDLSALFAMDPRQTERAAECGLRSFWILAGITGQTPRHAELYSYEGPFGVGYAIAAFDPQPVLPDESAKDSVDELYEDPWIALARTTIETFVETGRIIHVPDDLPDELHEARAGAFVTLHKDGNLRGCIGTIEPTQDSLAEEIIYNAIAAATRDPRFPSIKADELPDLDISVDVLCVPETIASAADLDVKRYGVIVSHDFRRGLLLPNLDGVDTVEDQVEIAREKAGIEPHESYQLERFEVIRHEPVYRLK